MLPEQRCPIDQEVRSEISTTAMLVTSGLHNLVLIVEPEAEHLVGCAADRPTGGHQVSHLCEREQERTFLVPLGHNTLRSRWIGCVHPKKEEEIGMGGWLETIKPSVEAKPVSRRTLRRHRRVGSGGLDLK